MIECTINGRFLKLEIPGNRRLIDVIREDLGLTGTKQGCGIGECGACTVLIDGKASNACLVLIGQIQGKEILTVEGLAENDNLTELQENFLRLGAVQCGYCTPGMLLSAAALLQSNPDPDDEEIKEAIAGNLCRCTGYKPIIEAIKQTALDTKKVET
jgi:carbon-monoxide dehydrogenase small subunit